MDKTKETSKQNGYLVMKVSPTDTIRNIPVGKSVTFDCRELGSMSTAKSCVSRLNKDAGREEYRITSDDNGATYTVTHN